MCHLLSVHILAIRAEMVLHLHSVSYLTLLVNLYSWCCHRYYRHVTYGAVYKLFVFQFRVVLYITALTAVYLSPVISELNIHSDMNKCRMCMTKGVGRLKV